ncbi:hypothetical protein [Nocardioides sp. Kera G14]|uniref:hypothetical protein n=1 Tax=Nocardioides sp. Kera G14 TaxID=2884264 RepID=UPI001D10A3FA|nr:hypothetical protein [Nocardioides sp. Kera G14]UDY24151.1 hypothetical protein LH076_02315 [Nocardioides sp. Kera G14]
MGARGKRAGARTKARIPRRALALLAGGVVALALWIYLVWSAIHFGSSARGGDDSDWWLAGAMTVGAIAALFVCMMLLVQAGRVAGVAATPPPKAPRTHGGKRAAR